MIRHIWWVVQDVGEWHLSIKKFVCIIALLFRSSMDLSDIIASLHRGMHVRVWAETIWPGPKPVALIYDGIFMALTPEHTRTASFPKERSDCVTYPLYGEPYIGLTLNVMVLSNATSVCSVDDKVRRHTRTQIVIHTVMGMFVRLAHGPYFLVSQMSRFVLKHIIHSMWKRSMDGFWRAFGPQRMTDKRPPQWRIYSTQWETMVSQD